MNLHYMFDLIQIEMCVENMCIHMNKVSINMANLLLELENIVQNNALFITNITAVSSLLSVCNGHNTRFKCHSRRLHG